jgi:hypothetical protein
VVSGWWLAAERGESMLGGCGRSLGAPSDTASHHRRHESSVVSLAADMILSCTEKVLSLIDDFCYLVH